MRSMQRLAGLLFSGAVLASFSALAAATDLEELAQNPQRFLDQEIEVQGFCVQGGRSGDVLGYECITDGAIYVDADDITPEESKKKLADDCAASQKDECRATIRFKPHSYTTSEVIDPGKAIVVFNTEKAEVSF